MKTSEILLQAYDRVLDYHGRGIVNPPVGQEPTAGVKCDQLDWDGKICWDSMCSLQQSLRDDAAHRGVRYEPSALYEAHAYNLMVEACADHGFAAVVDMNDAATEEQFHAIWAYAIMLALEEE